MPNIREIDIAIDALCRVIHADSHQVNCVRCTRTLIPPPPIPDGQVSSSPVNYRYSIDLSYHKTMYTYEVAHGQAHFISQRPN